MPPPFHPLSADRARQAGAGWYARLIAAASAGAEGTKGSTGGVVARMTVVNGSGQGSPDMQWFTFGHVFARGDIPPGHHPQPRFSPGLHPLAWQVDGIVRRHRDGSVNHASFALLLPRLAPGETVEVSFVARPGDPPPPGPLTVQPLLDAAYAVDLDLDGTLWSADLAAGITAGTARVERDGPVLKRITVWTPLTAKGVVHPDLWARFYADVYTTGERDGTTDDGYLCATAVLASVVNGRMAKAGALAPAGLRLRRRGGIIWRHDAAFSFNAHSTVYCTSDGLPLYDDLYRGLKQQRPGKPVVHHRPDRGYMARARALLPLDTGIAAHRASAAPAEHATLVPGRLAPWEKSLNAGGDAWWIGPLSRFTARAYTTLSPDDLAVDRVIALQWGQWPNTQFWTDRQCRVPVLTRQGFQGLDDVDGSYAAVGWQADDTGGLNGPFEGFSPANGSHNPDPAFFQMLYTGDEWFRDLQRSLGVLAVANHAPDNGNRFRDGFDGVVEETQVRSWAWNMRALENWWWIEPETTPEGLYAAYLREQNWRWRAHWIDVVIDQDRYVTSRFQKTPGRMGGAGVRVPRWSDAKGMGVHHGVYFQNDFAAYTDLLAAFRDDAPDPRASLPWREVEFTVLGEVLGRHYPPHGGHPFHMGTYMVDMKPQGREADSFAGFRVYRKDAPPDQWPPLVPTPPPGDGIDPAVSLSSPVQYAWQRRGLGRIVRMLGEIHGDALMTDMGGYIDRVVTAADAPQPSPADWADDPRWLFAATMPALEYPVEEDHAAARLESAGDWSWVAVSRHGAAEALPFWDTGETPDNNRPYWGYRGTPVPVAGHRGTANFSYSAGRYIHDRKHFVFTGGGHQDYGGSEILVWSPRSGRWTRVEDSARYALWDQAMIDTVDWSVVPYGSPEYAPSLAPYQFGPSPDDPFRNDKPTHLRVQRHHVNRENIRGRLGPPSLHTYGSMEWIPNRRMLWSRGGAWWPSGGTKFHVLWAIDGDDGRYWWDHARSRHWQDPDGSPAYRSRFDEWNLWSPGADRMICLERGSGTIWFIDPDTGTRTVAFEGPVHPMCSGVLVPDPISPGGRALLIAADNPYDKSFPKFALISGMDNPRPHSAYRRRLTVIDGGPVDAGAFNVGGAALWLGEHAPALAHLAVMAKITTDAPGLTLAMVDMRDANPARWVWTDLTTKLPPLEGVETTVGMMTRNFWYDADYDAFFLINSFRGKTVWAMKRPSDVMV
jgi:hypothetical protein